MNLAHNIFRGIMGVGLAVALASVFTFAQQSRGTLRGVVKDELGAAIVGANVTLTDAVGAQKKTVSNGEGVYTFTGLAPGKYVMQATAPGFAILTDREFEIVNGQRQTIDITLKVTIEESKVTVAADTPLNTEAAGNANQTLITGKDLDALPDDPDELAAALQALAGPSVGPNGGQIFIDGFSGGNLPSKESIREIRINQNPFSAENDQPSGRIDILTKPGTDKFRGSTSFNFNDESLNSRNPFATSSSKRTPFQIRQYNLNLSGPLVKHKASFFLEFGRFDTDDNELVNVTVLEPGTLAIVPFGQAVLVPRRNTNIGPRIDYAINSHNTLVARYNYNRSRTDNNGVNGFSLPERAYDTLSTFQTFQLTETAVLNPTTINETRFQYLRARTEQLGNNTVPTLTVSGSFSGGGSGIGQAVNENNRWELNNFTAMQKGSHAIKFGGRVRGVHVNDTSPTNFGGSWVFTGGYGLSSIQRYQLTLQLQQQGFTPEQIRERGGGAAQFSINAGNPFASVSQTDYGLYVQDDWRARPNLTFSYGIRYENQTNAHSKFDFAPRVAVAWSPGAAKSARPPKMVIRAGGGIFYNRFSEGSTLIAHRFNGLNEQQFAITEEARRLVPPTVAEQQAPSVQAVYAALNSFTPSTVPSIAGVSATQQTVWQVDPNLQVPTVYVLGTQVERQLPRNITMYVGFYAIQIQHVIRARDVNAPLPGTIIPEISPNGIRPDPTRGEIYRFEASGRFRQKQFFVGFNSRLSRALTISGNYSLSKSTNDTDGQGGLLFPMNSYDTSGEKGRSSFDVRHRFTLFGTVNLPWWKVVLNPFIIANTGPPFNITTGQDLNLDRQTNERPSFAGPNANCASSFIRCTPYGNFNLQPLPGEKLVPRNYGHAPGSFSVNLRVSRSFAFGTIHKASAVAASSQPQTQKATSERPAGGQRPSGIGGPTMIAGGGGAPGGGPGGGGGQRVVVGGPGGPGGGTPAEKRFNLTASINFQNLLNNVNLAPPIGNLLSPRFGQSLSLGGSFGGFGGGGGGGSTGAGNRRIYAQVRLNF